jgi:hypothetical protein
MTKDGCPLGTSSFSLVPPSFNNKHHFLHPTSLIAPSQYTLTIRLEISAGRIFLAFKMVSPAALHS